MNQTIHPVSKKQGNITFCMSSDYFVSIATLDLSSPFLHYTDKNKYREIDPFLIPVKTNSITLEYAKEKWEYATYFNRLLPKKKSFN